MSIVFWAQEAVLLILGLFWAIWDRYMQVLYLGRALRTKETLPDFLMWRRVTRHPLVFRGLTGSQRTPGFWGVTGNTFIYKNQDKTAENAKTKLYLQKRRKKN